MHTYIILQQKCNKGKHEEPNAGTCLGGSQQKAEGTREKSSANQLYEKPRMGTANIWERDREGGTSAQSSDCSG